MAIGSFVLAGIDDSYVAAAVTLGFLGFFGGFYSVPLNAMLQQKADEDKRGRFIAANNVMNTLGIILASGVLAVSGGWLGLSPKANAVLAGVCAIAVIAYLLILLPDFLIRFCLWLLTHSIYRIRIIGPENVPLNGPALLVANHLSFIDGVAGRRLRAALRPLHGLCAVLRHAHPRRAVQADARDPDRWGWCPRRDRFDPAVA